MTRIFEQPLNEKLRNYLRLEQTFTRYFQLIRQTDAACHYAAFAPLFELLEMIDLGELRADLHSDLDKQIAVLDNFRRSPDIDLDKLQKFREQLQKLHHWIVSFPGKFCAKLKDQEFLHAVKNRYALPGGTVACDLPRLHVFLNQDVKLRQQQFEAWGNELRVIRTTIDVLLRLMRENSHWREAAFDEGYFQLEPVQGQLLRIRIEHDARHFPEVSSGRQRCVIRLAEVTDTFGVQYVKAAHPFTYALCG